MDVTYIHIPSYGWWYAVTVIDYYSRYLLACHLTSRYFRERYNPRRPHWALVPEAGGDPWVPAEVYIAALASTFPAAYSFRIIGRDQRSRLDDTRRTTA